MDSGGEEVTSQEERNSLALWLFGPQAIGSEPTHRQADSSISGQNYRITKKLARALGDLGASVPAWFSATEYSRRVYLHFRSTDLNQDQVPQCWRTVQKAFF